MLKLRFLFFLIIPFLSEATICLNMIVKNESHVITRCLESVKPIIDYWVIVDTGSTDGTQQLIRECLKDIKGELHEKLWKNFGENRNEALMLAKDKSDYILIMDADDILEYDQGFSIENLTEDLYFFWRGPQKGRAGNPFYNAQLIKTDLPWKWQGVVHEQLICDQSYTSKILPNIRYVCIEDGASYKDPEKYLKYVNLLLEGMKKEPTNSRYAFYIAQSYFSLGEKGKALEWYQKRAKMGGSAEEIFWSLLVSSFLMNEIGFAPNIVIESYLNAHNNRPHRCEPIYFLAELYNKQGNYTKSYELLKAAQKISQPTVPDKLFYVDAIQNYGLLFQLAVTTYYLSYNEEALEYSQQLLAKNDLPQAIKAQAEAINAVSQARLQPASNSKESEN